MTGRTITDFNNIFALCFKREVLIKTCNAETTDDQLFTVETVSCLGACGLAPAVMINDEVYGKMTPEKMSELIKKLREE